MSDALSFLVKARPQAMGHYFSFLKEAGRHLDPKTRSLISVITKAHAQTERGLKQYVKRALAEGCTPAEVLDALLMAFPALGLARIVWAVGVMLTMDLPGFTPEGLADGARWRDVMAAGALEPGEARRVECEGRGLFVVRDGDEIRIHDSLCPHQGTDIQPLALDGDTLTCPKHQWAFDIRSGACLRNGDKPLRRIESRVANGRVEALW